MATTPSLDHVVDTTPNDRNRVVDAVRAGSILVVVLWHWSMSVLRWNDGGALTMANPIDSLPGAWLATWVLQVMPLFFVVGGYANLTSLRHRSRSLAEFARERARRLVLPLLPMMMVWAAVDTGGLLLRGDDHRSVLDRGFVVFVPLWFIGVFAGVSMLAPITVRLHRQAPYGTLAALAAGIAIVDTLRFATGVSIIGWINLVLVFTFAHQLGYFWRDSRGAHLAPLLVVGSATLLVLMTGVGPYPGSMVATESTAFPNMNPTTAPIAVVAVLVLFLAIWSGMGRELLTEPTAAWWLSRPIWILGPGTVLAAIVLVGRRVAPRWIGIPVLSEGSSSSPCSRTACTSR